MAPWYHTTKVHNLQIVAVLQSHGTILPQYTFCRLTQYYSLHYSFHQPPPTTSHHKAPNTTSQDPPKTKNHHTPRATKETHWPKSTENTQNHRKNKNRKDKNPLYYISWVRIPQWLGRWSCKPLVMGSIPGCGGTPSILQSDNPQSATRIKDYFRRSQNIYIYIICIFFAAQCIFVTFAAHLLFTPEAVSNFNLNKVCSCIELMSVTKCIHQHIWLLFV